MKMNNQTTHFDARPRRPSDPRMVIVFVIGAAAGVCLALVFIAPMILRVKEVMP